MKAWLCFFSFAVWAQSVIAAPWAAPPLPYVWPKNFADIDHKFYGFATATGTGTAPGSTGTGAPPVTASTGTGTAGMVRRAVATGTCTGTIDGSALATPAPDFNDVQAAAALHRRQFEGPRQAGLRGWYPAARADNPIAAASGTALPTGTMR